MGIELLVKVAIVQLALSKIFHCLDGLLQIFIISEIAGSKADGAVLRNGAEQLVNIGSAVKARTNTDRMICVKHGADLVCRQVPDIDGQG